VTIDTEALLIARHAAIGGELIRLAVSRAEPVGSGESARLAWRPALPVTQFVWVKP